ncbi:hypothetical protein N9D38_05800 [Rubripirellula sp.]|nr:hypothetical protein [Rubripirellula sp.]
MLIRSRHFFVFPALFSSLRIVAPWPSRIRLTAEDPPAGSERSGLLMVAQSQVAMVSSRYVDGHSQSLMNNAPNPPTHNPPTPNPPTPNPPMNNPPMNNPPMNDQSADSRTAVSGVSADVHEQHLRQTGGRASTVPR